MGYRIESSRHPEASPQGRFILGCERSKSPVVALSTTIGKITSALRKAVHQEGASFGPGGGGDGCFLSTHDMTISIKTVTHEQFVDWLRLRTAVYTGIDNEFHEQEMQQFLADGSKRCFVAEIDCGVVCGMIEVSLRNVVDGCLSSPVGYVEGIYVDPFQRGAGLSKRLLHTAEEWCRSMGCTEMATDAEIENEEAQRFHEHMGFEETYRIVEYRKKL